MKKGSEQRKSTVMKVPYCSLLCQIMSSRTLEPNTGRVRQVARSLVKTMISAKCSRWAATVDSAATLMEPGGLDGLRSQGQDSRLASLHRMEERDRGSSSRSRSCIELSIAELILLGKPSLSCQAYQAYQACQAVMRMTCSGALAAPPWQERTVSRACIYAFS